MHAESTHLEIRSFFHELGVGQAQILLQLLAAITHNGSPEDAMALAAHYEGYLRGLMEFRFGICGCGADHDAVAEHFIADETDQG